MHVKIRMAILSFSFPTRVLYVKQKFAHVNSQREQKLLDFVVAILKADRLYEGSPDILHALNGLWYS